MHEYSGFYKLLLSVLEQTDRAGKERGEKMANIEKFRGAVLGEVCGDALGYPLVTLIRVRLSDIMALLDFGPW